MANEILGLIAPENKPSHMNYFFLFNTYCYEIKYF